MGWYRSVQCRPHHHQPHGTAGPGLGLGWGGLCCHQLSVTDHWPGSLMAAACRCPLITHCLVYMSSSHPCLQQEVYTVVLRVNQSTRQKSCSDHISYNFLAKKVIYHQSFLLVSELCVTAGLSLQSSTSRNDFSAQTRSCDDTPYCVRYDIYSNTGSRFQLPYLT